MRHVSDVKCARLLKTDDVLLCFIMPTYDKNCEYTDIKQLVGVNVFRDDNGTNANDLCIYNT